MKIKKHLVAATLAVGLAGSATAMSPGEHNLPTAKIGYIVAYKITEYTNSEVAKGATTAILTAAGAAGGSRAAMWFGAKIGGSLGACFAGPVGAIAGAAGGAL